MLLCRLIVIGWEYYYELEEFSPNAKILTFLKFGFMYLNNNNQIQTPILLGPGRRIFRAVSMLSCNCHWGALEILQLEKLVPVIIHAAAVPKNFIEQIFVLSLTQECTFEQNFPNIPYNNDLTHIVKSQCTRPDSLLAAHHLKPTWNRNTVHAAKPSPPNSLFPFHYPTYQLRTWSTGAISTAPAGIPKSVPGIYLTVCNTWSSAQPTQGNPEPQHTRQLPWHSLQS